MKYELRQIDAWGNQETGYEYNATYHIGHMETRAENIKQAISNHLRNYHGIRFPRGAVSIEYVFDGDLYEICCRKTKQPLIVAIPIYKGAEK